MLHLENMVEVLARVCADEGLAVAAVDGRGHVTYWSACAAQLFGRPAEEVLRKPVANLAPAAADHFEEMLEAVRAARPAREFVVYVTRGEATPVHVRLRVTAADNSGCVLVARAV